MAWLQRVGLESLKFGPLSWFVFLNFLVDSLPYAMTNAHSLLRLQSAPHRIIIVWGCVSLRVTRRPRWSACPWPTFSVRILENSIAFESKNAPSACVILLCQSVLSLLPTLKSNLKNAATCRCRRRHTSKFDQSDDSELQRQWPLLVLSCGPCKCQHR